MGVEVDHMPTTVLVVLGRAGEPAERIVFEAQRADVVISVTRGGALTSY